MGLYIKGMEMPTNCDKCRISFNVGRSEYLCQLCTDPNPCVEGGEFWRECGEGADEKRPNWCPLVEVPPHGRLIDADALSQIHGEFAYEKSGRNYGFHMTAKAWIDEAPTIIPAEEVDDERVD